MSKEDVIQMQGEVLENLPNATFRVKLENGHVSTGLYIRKDADALHPHPPGDKVTVELHPVRFCPRAGSFSGPNDFCPAACCRRVNGENHESTGFSQENVPQVQGCTSQGRCARDL
jgi:translation initiation factor IF-1